MEPMQPMKPMSPMKPMAPASTLDAPADWGQPASVGGQNGAKYAWFRDKARLVVVDAGGKRTVYDTADHAIGGVSQGQANGRPGTLTFTSQHGPVAVDSLKVVGDG